MSNPVRHYSNIPLHRFHLEPFDESIESQYELVQANPNNYFLKYDFLLRILSIVRRPLVDIPEAMTDIFASIYEILEQLTKSEKFGKQLEEKIAERFSERERQNFDSKAKEYKAKIAEKNSLYNISTHIHYLVLNANLTEALEHAKYGKIYAKSSYHFAQGVYYMKIPSGNPDEDVPMAIEHFKHVIKILPRHSHALSSLAGLYYVYHKDIKSALHCLKKSLYFDGKKENFEAHYQVAFILETELGKMELAKKHYAIAIEINPEHAPSYSNLGAILLEEGRYDDALKNFKMACKFAPEKKIVLYQIANCYSLKGLVEAAVVEMDRAIQLDKTLPHSHYHMANILFRHHDFDGAAKGYNKALKLAEKYPHHEFDSASAINNLVSVYRLHAQKIIVDAKHPKDHHKAALLLGRSIDLMAENNPLYTATMRLNMVYCLMKANEPIESLHQIEIAKEEGGDEFLEEFKSLKQSYTSHVVYSQLDKHKAELAAFDSYLKDYIKKCNEDNIEPDEQTLFHAQKDLSRCHYNIAFCLFQSGDIEQCYEHLSKAVSLIEPPYISDYIYDGGESDLNVNDARKPIIVGDVKMYTSPIPKSEILRDVLFKKLSELQKKYEGVELDTIVEPADFGPKSIRTEKVKRRKKLKYSKMASLKIKKMQSEALSQDPYNT